MKVDWNASFSCLFYVIPLIIFSLIELALDCASSMPWGGSADLSFRCEEKRNFARVGGVMVLGSNVGVL